MRVGSGCRLFFGGGVGRFDSDSPRNCGQDAARPPAAGWRQGRQHHHAQRQQQQQQQQQDEDDDNDLPVLTAEMESALRESKWLQAALGDSTLRRLLADVDGGGDAAASALAGRDRAARLKEALEKYPDLLAFVDKMLMEVGALRYEDGRLVFTSAT